MATYMRILKRIKYNFITIKLLRITSLVVIGAFLFIPRQEAPSVKTGMNEAGSGFAQASFATKEAAAVKPWSFTSLAWGWTGQNLSLAIARDKCPGEYKGHLRPLAKADKTDYASAASARAILSMDKASIDKIVDEAQLERRFLLVRSLNDAIALCGGLAQATPQERYALFRLLQNRDVIAATAGELTCVSPSSRGYLMQLTQEAADLGVGRYYFSRVATAVFSGMVKDGTFADFCEEAQNRNFRPLPGAANVVLVDCPVDLKAVSMGLYRIASFLSLFGVQAHVVNVAEEDTDITAGLPFYPHVIGKRFLTTTYQQDVDSMHKFEEVYPDSIYVAGGHEAAISNRVFTLAPRLRAAVMSWGEFAMLDMVVNLNPEGNMIPAAQRERCLDGIDGIRLKDRKILRRKPFSPMSFRVISQAYNPKLIMDSGVEMQCADIHGISHCSQGCIFCMADALFTDSAECRQRFLHIEPEDFAVIAARIKRYLPGVTWINLSDENFFMNTARAKRFFDMVEKEGLHRPLQIFM